MKKWCIIMQKIIMCKILKLFNVVSHFYSLLDVNKSDVFKTKY